MPQPSKPHKAAVRADDELEHRVSLARQGWDNPTKSERVGVLTEAYRPLVEAAQKVLTATSKAELLVAHLDLRAALKETV